MYWDCECISMHLTSVFIALPSRRQRYLAVKDYIAGKPEDQTWYSFTILFWQNILIVYRLNWILHVLHVEIDVNVALWRPITIDWSQTMFKLDYRGISDYQKHSLCVFLCKMLSFVGKLSAHYVPSRWRRINAAEHFCHRCTLSTMCLSYTGTIGTIKLCQLFWNMQFRH